MTTYVDGSHRSVPSVDFDDPRLYDSVRTRRIGGFLIDLFLVGLLSIPAAVVVFFLGIVTLGFAWGLYAVLIPAIWLAYSAYTIGKSGNATPGMAMAGIQIERMDGGRIDPSFALLHSVLFWAGNALITPAILVVALFTGRKQAAHDWLMGAVFVRRDEWRLRA